MNPEPEADKEARELFETLKDYDGAGSAVVRPLLEIIGRLVDRINFLEMDKQMGDECLVMVREALGLSADTSVAPMFFDTYIRNRLYMLQVASQKLMKMTDLLRQMQSFWDKKNLTGVDIKILQILEE